MSKTNFFIGFPSFEALLASALNKTVYISKAVVTRPGQFNTAFVEHNVTATVVGENICHYWKMPLGSYQQMGDAPLVAAKDYPVQCAARASSAVEVLSELARDLDFTVIHGLIGFPRDLTVLEGTLHSFRYVEAENRFERKPEVKTPEKADELEDSEKLAA